MVLSSVRWLMHFVEIRTSGHDIAHVLTRLYICCVSGNTLSNTDDEPTSTRTMDESESDETSFVSVCELIRDYNNFMPVSEAIDEKKA